MKTYAFLLRDSWRVEAKASNARKAYLELKKKFGDKVTKLYIKYNKNGVQMHDWHGLR